MSNTVLAIILVALAIITFVAYYFLAYRQRVIIIQLLKELKDANKDKQRIETTQEEPAKHKWKQAKVAQPSPEEIAPALRSPPRPQGGFGVVLRTDDNTPVREADRGKVGSEGGEAKSPTTATASEACGLPPASGQTPKSGRG